MLYFKKFNIIVGDCSAKKYFDDLKEKLKDYKIVEYPLGLDFPTIENIEKSLEFLEDKSETKFLIFTTNIYILSYLNNALLYYEQLKKGCNIQSHPKFMISPEKLSVTQVIKGKIKDIYDYEDNLVLCEELDKCSEDLSKQFDNMLFSGM